MPRTLSILVCVMLLSACTKEQAASSIETLGRGLCAGSSQCTNRCPDGTTVSRYPSGYDCGDPYARRPDQRGPN